MAFVKFMRNKFFHPHTFENQKRTWIAEQKHETEKKKQEELHKQYLKEQAIYENKNLLKHGKLTQDDKLSFMYEPPLECRKKDDKLELREVRFEWQKNAPRAGEYAKNIEVTDRPFGIEVRNTKCIKCGVWGHMNTDKICPLYNQGLNTEDNPPELGKEDPMSLLNSMERGGLKMRKHAVNAVMDVHDNKFGMLEDEKRDPEVAFIANLTDKQKRKLMRKLNKNDSVVGNVPKAKHKAKKKKKKSKRNEETVEDESDIKASEKQKDRHQRGSHKSTNNEDKIRDSHVRRSRSPNVDRAPRRKERDTRENRLNDDHPSTSHRRKSSGSTGRRHDSPDSNSDDGNHRSRKRVNSNSESRRSRNSRNDGKKDSEKDSQKVARNKRRRYDQSKSPEKSAKRHESSSESDSSHHEEKHKKKGSKTKYDHDSDRKSRDKIRHKHKRESRRSNSSE